MQMLGLNGLSRQRTPLTLLLTIIPLNKPSSPCNEYKYELRVTEM
jgi:hypothetical protein